MALGLDDVVAASNRVREDKNVVVDFISITGSGLKVLVYGPKAKTADEYTAVYNRILEFKGKQWGLAEKADTGTKDCSRLCYLSFDPQLYVNWNAVPVALEDLPDVDPPQDTSTAGKKVSKEQEPAEPANDDGEPQPGSAGVPLEINWEEAGGIPSVPDYDGISLPTCLEAMRHIVPNREIWVKVGAALKLAYGDGAFDVYNSWSSHFEGYRGTESCRKNWESHRRGEGENVVTPRTILKLARDGGWKPAFERVEGRRPTAARTTNSPQSEEEKEEQARKLRERLEKYTTHSIVELAEMPIDESKTLLGERFLCIGGGSVVVGSTGTGKSTMVAGMVVDWSLGKPAFGIQPKRPLRILVIQAENDDGDMTEMTEGLVSSLTAEERELAHQNTVCVRINDLCGMDFISMLDLLLETHKPDLLLLDPFNAFSGGDASDPKIVTPFLRNWLNPLLDKHQCGLVLVHHTPKTRNWDTSKWKFYDWVYAASGSAELSNWCRSMLVVEPTDDMHVFRLIAAKRGKRIGWGYDFDGPVVMKYYAQSQGKDAPLIWTEATEDQIARVEKMKMDKRNKGAAEKKYSATELYRVLLDFDNSVTSAEWLKRAQATPKLIVDGKPISRTTFYRLVEELKNSKRVEQDEDGKYATSTDVPT